MSTKLADLAEKLNISVKDLKVKIEELGFELSPKARTIEDDIAELIEDELSGEDDSPEGIAEIYDEILAEEREREIIKTQRKKTAGKIVLSKDEKNENQSTDLKKKKGVVEIPDSISVKEFAEKTEISAAKVIGELMKNGILTNINQQIDFETAQIIADDLGIKLKRLREVAGAEELMSGDISNLIKEDDSSFLKERPPVICVMGHVDHGKTKLLDSVRSTNVADGESGGITQHIGAYQVENKGRFLTFLDTPGHEAFTSMRARGAKVTDIAILVVAADDGVKPQTIEAINHAKEAKVPIIVAINKMDKPGVTPDKVKAELSEHGLQSEDWGGDTIMVPISALKGDGIEDLLDMVILTADMLELKANPDREAIGTVVEANLDHSLGPVATVLINTGTLKTSNSVIVGNTYGRIKLMKDHTGKNLRVAKPSTPVLIAGLNDTPKSGDILQVVSNEKAARQRAEEITFMNKKTQQEKMSASNMLIANVKSEKILRLILKADVKGSLEAIRQSLEKIKDEEVAIKIIHSAVGTVTESDVMMAAASRGLVLAFNTDFDPPHVAKIAERENVQVKKYNVIYDLIEDIKVILSGLLEPEMLEHVIGRAEVKQIFLSKKKEFILGARILSGKLKNKAKLKVIRGRTPEDEDNIVGAGVIDSLRKVDEVVNELKEGNECGIKFVGNIDPNEGDILEAFEEEEKKRTIT
jgi:translation initiation factor IF-2